MIKRFIAATATGLLLWTPAAYAQPTGNTTSTASQEDELGDFDFELEDQPAATAPWKLATTRDGLIAQEAETEEEIDAIAILLRAQKQGKWLIKRDKSLSGLQAAHWKIENPAEVTVPLAEGVSTNLWTQAQADAWLKEYQDMNGDGVRKMTDRNKLLAGRLQQVQAALK